MREKRTTRGGESDSRTDGRRRAARAGKIEEVSGPTLQYRLIAQRLLVIKAIK